MYNGYLDAVAAPHRQSMFQWLPCHQGGSSYVTVQHAHAQRLVDTLTNTRMSFRLATSEVPPPPTQGQDEEELPQSGFQ